MIAVYAHIDHAVSRAVNYVAARKCWPRGYALSVTEASIVGTGEKCYVVGVLRRGGALTPLRTVLRIKPKVKQ